MNDLEDFYNNRIKLDQMPDFEQLHQTEKERLEASLSFALWRLGQSAQRFSTVFKSELLAGIKRFFPDRVIRRKTLRK